MSGYLSPGTVVLHEPEIPNNTGNIGRTCVALGAPLRVIHPLGFEMSEKALRRAGLDYWPRLDFAEHQDWAAYTEAAQDSNRWLFTTRATRSIYDVELKPGDHLVFGKETAGLPAELLEAEPERCVCLPMRSGERSLNLATAVCSVLYEAIGQQVRRGERVLGPAGRLD